MRKNEDDIVNKRIASVLREINNQDFWCEIKHIKHNGSVVSGVPDGLSYSSETANSFASKSQDLYTEVSYDIGDREEQFQWSDVYGMQTGDG